MVYRELHYIIVLTNLIVNLYNDVVGVHNQLVLGISLYWAYNCITIKKVQYSPTQY